MLQLETPQDVCNLQRREGFCFNFNLNTVHRLFLLDML